MLQEATKILNSAFHNSFIKKASLYLHDCVREEVKSSTFRNLKQDKDNKWIFLNESHLMYDGSRPKKSKNPVKEKLFTEFPDILYLNGEDNNITEMMIQSENGQKDKYLIYGYLFLVGRNSKTKRDNEFLTPLLYMPCHLEREGLSIKCSLLDEVLSVNTGALTALMNKSADEEENEEMLEGILDVVPKLPLTEEGLQIFTTTLKSLIPDIEIKLNHEEDSCEDSDSIKNFPKTYKKELQSDEFEEDTDKNKLKDTIDKVRITNECALILTKRPDVTAGVLHELTRISEFPSGVFRETVLNVINEEFSSVKSKITDLPTQKDRELSSFCTVTPLPLSDSQEDVIKYMDKSPLIAVSGPPGTGKSQTIVNLVSHLVANGKTVLVASRMDKATDVVAERLNALGAPYLAIRAGRANYQKQLANQLQNLLSNQIDLDTDFEDSMLANVDDMENLCGKITEIKKNCDKIIKLEEDWYKTISEIQNYNDKKSAFIKEKINLKDINTVKNILEALEKSLKQSNFLTEIKNKIDLFKMKKILNLSDFNVETRNLMQLRKELYVSELDARAAEIESEIFKTGNITELTEEIHKLLKEQKILAKNILKNVRRESLKGLLRDIKKRQRLNIHIHALTAERKKNLQYRLLEEEDFKPLLEAFPCQCVTTYAVSGALPLKPGLFDVVIIDEASQCDIASCIPLLFRAKKAVIVGDDKQLPHLSFLENAKEQSFMSQYNIPDKYRLIWRFRTNSMYDLAGYYCMTPIMLNEHFRSLPPIIDFSNKEFYTNALRIMTKNNPDEKVLDLCRVPNGKVDSDATRNLPEIEAIMEKLHEIIIADEAKGREKGYKPVSIGIISPFRGQVEAIKKALLKSFSQATLERHMIDVGTAHTFQGDERDIIIMSWAIADNSFAQSLTFLQKPNLFNVAVTRAKKQCISFLSKDPSTLQPGLLRDYIEYVNNYLIQKKEEEENGIVNVFNNDFEETVSEELEKKGFKVRANYHVAGVYADLMITNDKGKSLIVECDGVPDEKRTNMSMIKKQLLLERAGYTVTRISYRDWTYSQNACVSRVIELLK